MVQIAPSILSADFANLARDIDIVARGGAHALHVDVMDGHFVPNISIGIPVVQALKMTTRLPLDVHLMIENPERFVPDFVKAGADLLAVHVEACPHIHRVITMIKSSGVKAGIALNPGTPLGSLSEILHMVNFVLIMSVNPGFGGQSFIPDSIDKIRRLSNVIHSRDLNVTIAVDGGVSENNAADLVTAGARLLVAGSSIFKSSDPAEAVRRLIAITHPIGSSHT
ncbi:ribulose-phosphate 3-epimerase [bacterium]|nr:ribulose-phosphate 3-epimerase [candidate division CSSED10-310 bacterium]